MRVRGRREAAESKRGVEIKGKPRETSQKRRSTFFNRSRSAGRPAGPTGLVFSHTRIRQLDRDASREFATRRAKPEMRSGPISVGFSSDGRERDIERAQHGQGRQKNEFRARLTVNCTRSFPKWPTPYSPAAQIRPRTSPGVDTALVALCRVDRAERRPAKARPGRSLWLESDFVWTVSYRASYRG